MYVREWNNLQYVSSAAFLLAVYSDYLSAANAKLTCPVALVQPQDLLYFAKSQADYILGKNPKSMSYLVGYGQKYPIQVHHRGASIAAISVLQFVVKCVEGFETWYRRSEGNPNVINGALVGGPDKNDEFLDNRSNYEQTEPTICNLEYCDECSFTAAKPGMAWLLLCKSLTKKVSKVTERVD